MILVTQYIDMLKELGSNPVPFLYMKISPTLVCLRMHARTRACSLAHTLICMHGCAHAHLPCARMHGRRALGQNSKTVFVPHSPGNLNDIQSQIAQGVMQGSQA